MSLVRKLAVVVSVLVFIGVAQAATEVPNFPGWWLNPGDPPDGVTRTQYHSFLADPNLNQPPDYTCNGFPPSVADMWSVPAATPYNQPIASPSGYPFWNAEGRVLGDKVGAYLPQGGTLTKLMGNRYMEAWYKQFFVAVIWQGPGALTMNAAALGSTVSGSQYQIDEPYGNWHATFFEGAIVPQPNSETFTFAFAGAGMYIDSIFVGTHCVPEPATVSLLVLGGAMIVRRRRA